MAKHRMPVTRQKQLATANRLQMLPIGNVGEKTQ